MRLNKKIKEELIGKPLSQWEDIELSKMSKSVTVSADLLANIKAEISIREKCVKDNFRVDGYLENIEDIHDGYFLFRKEGDKVLYPFMKIRSGGTDSYPQYCYIMQKA